jgi:hypothetical protein
MTFEQQEERKKEEEENEDNQLIDQTVIDTPRCKANNCFISIDFRFSFSNNVKKQSTSKKTQVFEDEYLIFCFLAVYLFSLLISRIE